MRTGAEVVGLDNPDIDVQVYGRSQEWRLLWSSMTLARAPLEHLLQWPRPHRTQTARPPIALTLLYPTALTRKTPPSRRRRPIRLSRSAAHTRPSPTMSAKASGADPRPNGDAKSRQHHDGSSGRAFTVEQKAAVVRIKRCSPTAFYEILGLEEVKTTCSDSEIKKAYRKLSLLTHPDKNGYEGADEAFKRTCALHVVYLVILWVVERAMLNYL